MNFKEDVIEASYTKPILVDFWAPWCGPCQFLGPVLEELEKEANQRWRLVKVNTDQNPEISTAYNIKSIPAVKLMIKGEVKAEFNGALPKPQIERWLEEFIPDSRKNDLIILQSELESDPDAAINSLEEFVTQNPDMMDAQIILARALAFRDPVRAFDLVKSLKPGNPNYDVQVNIKTLQSLINLNAEDISQFSEKLTKIQEDLQNKKLEEAVKTLIEIVSINRSALNDLARLGLIAIFNLMGHNHQITKNYRKKFDMVLY